MTKLLTKKPLTFEDWMSKVDAMGIKEGIFDPPDAKFLCPGSTSRRPYTGTDGVFFELFQSGLPWQFALGEALIEQDGE